MEEVTSVEALRSDFVSRFGRSRKSLTEGIASIEIGPPTNVKHVMGVSLTSSPDSSPLYGEHGGSEDHDEDRDGAAAATIAADEVAFGAGGIEMGSLVGAEGNGALLMGRGGGDLEAGRRDISRRDFSRAASDMVSERWRDLRMSRGVYQLLTLAILFCSAIY